VSSLNYFKGVILVQLFYAFCITLFVYSLPPDEVPFLQSYSNLSEDISMETISDDVENTLTQQTQIPVVELGALVLFSGNILIDLLVNFAFALPQMVTLLITGIMSQFMNVDGGIVLVVQTFASVTIMVLYMLGVLQLLTNIRSRGSVI
jgi:hypothetical protein